MTDDRDSQPNREKALRPWHSNPDSYLKALVLFLSLASAYTSFNEAILKSRIANCANSQRADTAECKKLAPQVAQYRTSLEAKDSARKEEQQQVVEVASTPAPEPAPNYSSPEPVLPSRDTVAADILAVACGNQVGLVAYDAIGGQLKGLLEGDGINPEEVHRNWDYYYSRAKEMNDIKGYGCIQ